MGPLAGLRVIELVGLGPGPFCAMLLSDLGAEVLRIDRPEAVDATLGSLGTLGYDDVICRGRQSVALDLKRPAGVDLLLGLVQQADALIEGFRPGVVERLGIGPDACAARNPRLIYGRMTGWGQVGPWAQRPGHDLNYISMSGIGAAIGAKAGPPVPPLNLVGDFGGGGMLLALGILAALHERERSDEGQVIDAAMVDGTCLLGAAFYGWHDAGGWSLQRGENLLDGGAPFYDYYATADERYVAVAALEPSFYRELLRVLGLEEAGLPSQYDQAGWPTIRKRFQEVFATRTREEWIEAQGEAEACISPVLDMDEARSHPLNVAREVFVESDSKLQPRPAPRFSRSQPGLPARAARPGEHTAKALLDWGLTESSVSELLAAGVLRQR